MRKFKVLQTLSRQLKQKEEWKDWDFVVEIEQRASDANPAIRAGYWSWVEIDWGDGNGTQRYNTLNNAAGSIRYDGTLEPGTYQIKIRCNPDATHGSRYVKFGPDASNSGSGFYLKNTYCPQLKRVLKADMSHQRQMSYMFCKCYRLEEVCKITNSGHLTATNFAFSNCIALRGTVAFDSLESNTGSSNCFYNTLHLDRALLGPMPNCTSLSVAFSRSGVNEVVLSDLKKCAAVNSLFNLAKNLKKFVIPGGLPAATNLDSMFNTSSSLEEVDIGTDFPNATTTNEMFIRCSSLKNLNDLKSFPKNKDFTSMFSGCTSLEEVELEIGDESTTFNSTFNCCRSLRRVSLDGSFEKVTTITMMCQNARSLRELIVNGKPNELPGLPLCTNLGSAFLNTQLKGSFKIGDLPEATSLASTFAGMRLIEHIEIGDVGELDPETQGHVACNAGTICQNCFSLKSFKVGDYSINNWSNAFVGCFELEEAEFGEIGFTSTTGHDNDGIMQPYYMFSNCPSLKHVRGNLMFRRSGPNNNSYFANAFENCTQLEELPRIFPEDGFAETFIYPAAQFPSVFSNCISMSGTVPEWLWDADDPRHFKGTGSKGNAFWNCLKLSNYDDIPNTWKGNLDL